MLMARENLDQPLNEPKNRLIKFNEQISSKYKAGLSLNYLDNYLGDNVVLSSIQEFIQENQYISSNSRQFETILDKEDAIISDALNHASIIDGVRLCKAMRFRYSNNNMQELEQQLIAADAAGARNKLIVTDGVFSMDGVVANLSAICDLADQYNALVMVDDSHAVGFMGANGRGTHEYHDVIDRIDIITGTLGKAMGGASGGYTSGKKEVIDWLRQRSRPYLFSNSLAAIFIPRFFSFYIH
jgi:glycine C-acetyltransferase